MISQAPPRPGSRILALDFGKRRVGVAVSDPLHLIAHGRDTLLYRSKEELFQQLEKLIREEQVSQIVVGMPHNMDGSLGEMSKTVESFISHLQRRTQLPVMPWDERLSSKQAERALMEMGVRQRQRRESVDQLAAIFILQSYLDSIASKSLDSNL